MKRSHHPVLDAVADAAKQLREDAAEAEQLRRLPASTVRTLKDAGVMRLLQPKRYGGFEENPRIFYEAVMAVAAQSGSAGWVAGVVGVHPWQIALFDDQAQREVWGDDPDTWVSSAYLPTGEIAPVEGGYRVNGRWHFSSGSDHAGWAILGGTVEGPDGSHQFVQFLLPRSDYEIDDVWHVVGLQGTGSNDIVVKDAFVPAYRTLNGNVLMAHQIDWAQLPGLAVNNGPLYRMPFGIVFGNCIAAAIVGMGEGALQLQIDHQRERVRPLFGATAENPFALASIAEATWGVKVGRLQLLDDIDEMYAMVERGEEIPIELRYRARLNQVEFCSLAVNSIDRLFTDAGGAALRLSQPLQRFWRDIRGARNHPVCTKDRVLVPYGKLALGESPPVAPGI